jgi:hypothetical protein
VLVAIADCCDDNRHVPTRREIDRVTAIRHDKSIRDAVKMRHHSGAPR